MQGNLHCDCAIIGGGITGALIGYHLASAGVNAIVVDRRDIGTGSTSGSTGLLQYEVDTPLRELISKVGRASACRSYLLCGEAVLKLYQLARKLKIECDFRKKPSLQIARHKIEFSDLEEEFKLRKSLGIDVELWNEKELQAHFPFSKPVALFSVNGAEVDPHRLAHGLFRAGEKQGLRIFDRVKIINLSQSKRGVVLATEQGFKIHARRAVVAAGFESKQFFKKGPGSLKSTYALVSEPVDDLSGWYKESLIWETGMPYLYLRTLPDRRIIVGGEDENFVSSVRRDALISEKARILKTKFGALFSGIQLDVAYAWAGTFGETKDGLPYIGSPHGWPHVYFALGYGGNGIIYSLIAAEIIRDLFLKRSNRNAKIFAFDR